MTILVDAVAFLGPFVPIAVGFVATAFLGNSRRIVVKVKRG